MSRIVIVDDDFGMELLAENLGYLGHDVRRLASVQEAISNIDTLVKADLVVLDVIMPRGAADLTAEVSGSRTSGMSVFRAIRERNAILPVLAYTASRDADVLDLLRQDQYTTHLAKWSSPSMKEVIGLIQKLLGLEYKPPLPQPFIVHGHDDAAKLGLKNYLQNTLKLPEPIILHEQPNLGRTLIEKFEHYAAQSQLVFVLLTPDDKMVGATTSNDEKRRARQNVIFELGFFLGTLGRSSGRVILLYKPPLELPSDISGIIYIDISKGLESAGEQIRKELAHVFT